MAAVPLGDLHGQAAAGLLGQLGAEVRLGAKAAADRALARRRAPGPGRAVRRRDSRGRPRTAAASGASGRSVTLADGVVLAVPPGAGRPAGRRGAA